MRISNGLRLGVALASMASLTAAFIACSGSDNQDVTSTDAGIDTYRPPEPPDTGAYDAGPADTGPKDSGPVYDAGPSTVLDGGPLYDGGVACVLGGTIEEEPNDDETTANPLAHGSADPDAGDASPPAQCKSPGCSRCGVVFVSDPDAGDGGDAGVDPDWLKFQLAPSTTSFFLQFAGDISMDVSVEGQQTVTINANQNPAVPFVKDKTYYVHVRPNQSKQTPWRVTLFEQ